MIKKLLIAVAIIAVVVYFGLDSAKRYIMEKSIPASVKNDYKISWHKRKPAILNDFTKSIEKNYILKPDTRVLIAVKHIHNIITGNEMTSPQINFKDNKWEIIYNGENVGTLTELPDYNEILTFLNSWVEKTVKENNFQIVTKNAAYPEIDSNIKKFFFDNLFPALETINAKWSAGDKNQILLEKASEIYKLLLIQNLDKMGINDELPGIALAIDSILSYFNSARTSESMIITAYSMGYMNYAYQEGGKLADGNAVRYFVREKRDAMKVPAELCKEDIPENYLYYLKCAADMNQKDLDLWAQQYQPNDGVELSLQKIFSELTTFDNRLQTGTKITGKMLSDLGYEIPQSVWEADFEKEGSITDLFEKGIGKKTVSEQGVFIYDNLLQNYYRSYFYSALSLVGEHFRDIIASPEAVGNFIKTIDNSKLEKPAAFQTWFVFTAREITGESDKYSFKDQVTAANAFGASSSKKVYEAMLKECLEIYPTRIFEVVHEYAKSLDARPEYTGIMGLIYANYIYDNEMVKKYCGSSSERTTPFDYLFDVWLYQDDENKIKEIYEKCFLYRPNDCIHILYALGTHEKIDKDFMMAQYERLINTKPDLWQYVNSYAAYLLEKKEWIKAREVVQKWLDMKVEVKGLEYHNACSLLAETYAVENNYGEALNILKPILGDQVGEVYSKYIDILLRADKVDEAIPAAKECYERYPFSPWALRLYLQALWSKGRNKDAVYLLFMHKYPLTEDVLELSVAKGFVNVFRKKNDKEVLDAADSLKDVFAKYKRLPGYISDAAYNEQLYTLAWKLYKYQSFNDMPLENRIKSAVDGYKYCSKAESKDKAAKWARKHVPSLFINSLPAFAMEHPDTFDAVWDVIPGNPKGFGREYVWLARTELFLKDGRKNKEHEKLINDFISKPCDDISWLISKYLLGKASKDEVTVLCIDKKKITQVLYYLGLKEECDGNILEAKKYYRLSVEAGFAGKPEFAQSYRALQDLRTKDKMK